MPRKILVGGNWKSNGSRSSVKSLVETLNSEVPPSSVDVVVAPTFLHVDYVLQHLNKGYQVAVQNVTHLHDTGGAFTGEITATIAKDFGVGWAITGHSERRALTAESEEDVAKKTKFALDKGLNVILCIGETLQQREANETMEVLYKQMTPVISSLTEEDWTRVVIAYEPVWAIGTGVVATTSQAQEVHGDLRKWLATKLSANIADNLRILYGGSVKGSNSKELITQEDIDGFLVGGASLTADFLNIIKNSAGN